MTYHYSPSTRGIYHADQTPPADAVEFSAEAYTALMIGQSEGKEIQPGPDGVPVLVAPVVPPVDLKTYAAAARYSKETAGITAGGVKVSTDRGSQGQIANAYVLMQASGAASIPFKGADGVFTTLTADAFKSLALSVGAHVQACFAAEDQILADISSGKIKTTADVDAAFAAVTA